MQRSSIVALRAPLRVNTISPIAILVTRPNIWTVTLLEVAPGASRTRLVVAKNSGPNSADTRKSGVGDAETLQTLETIILIGKQHTLSFDAAGNLTQGDPALLEQEFVCLIERDDGTRDIIRPSELLKLSGLSAWPTTNSLLKR